MLNHHIELHPHTAHHWGKPVVELEYTTAGNYRYRAGADFETYWQAQPRIVSHDEAIALWPDDNGTEVITAITEARIPITLQDVITQLKALPPDVVPVLDTGGQPDAFLNPYRGNNADMALIPGSELHPARTLARLLASEIGSTRTGYKGGECLIHGQCGLWVAEYGEVTYRGVKGVTPDGVIQTALMSGVRDPVVVRCPHCHGAGHINS